MITMSLFSPTKGESSWLFLTAPPKTFCFPCFCRRTYLDYSGARTAYGMYVYGNVVVKKEKCFLFLYRVGFFDVFGNTWKKTTFFRKEKVLKFFFFPHK
jgi:hypothetical protein